MLQFTTITSSATETTIVTTVANTRLGLHGLVIANTSASAATVTIKETTAGATVMTFVVPAGETRGFMLPSQDAYYQSTAGNFTATCTSVASLYFTAHYVKMNM